MGHKWENTPAQNADAPTGWWANHEPNVFVVMFITAAFLLAAHLIYPLGNEGRPADGVLEFFGIAPSSGAPAAPDAPSSR